MDLQNFSKAILTLCLSSLFAMSVHAGVRDSGGGDACEERIKVTRDDLKDWIDAGGAKGLHLQYDFDLTQYNRVMSEVLAKDAVRIECVNEKVKLEGVEKICRFDLIEGQSPKITCARSAIQSSTDRDLYPLVHHEFAGIVGVERSVGADSDYFVSNQIAPNLAVAEKFKLVVRTDPAPRIEIVDDRFRVHSDLTEEIFSELRGRCASYGGHLPTALEWAKFAQSFGAKGVLETWEAEKFYEGKPEKTYRKVSTIILVSSSEGKSQQFFFDATGMKLPNEFGSGPFFVDGMINIGLAAFFPSARDLPAYESQNFRMVTTSAMKLTCLRP